MPGRCNFGRRLVGDRGEGVKVRLARRFPMVPHAGNQHRLRRIRVEVQDLILWLLSWPQLAVLVVVKIHVLIKAPRNQDRVVFSEQTFPELAQAVPAGVVKPGVDRARPPSARPGAGPRSKSGPRSRQTIHGRALSSSCTTRGASNQGWLRAQRRYVCVEHRTDAAI